MPAFLEMVIDPVCSLVFEAETDEEDIMRRKPRAPDKPLFTWPLVGWSVLQGGLCFGLVGAIFVIALQRGTPEDEARALTFFSLVLSIISLILVNRSFSMSLVAAFRRPNPALAWIILTIATILGLSLLWPSANALFRFGPLHADDLALVLAACMVVLLVLEILKHLWRARLALWQRSPLDSTAKCRRRTMRGPTPNRIDVTQFYHRTDRRLSASNRADS